MKCLKLYLNDIEKRSFRGSSNLFQNKTGWKPKIQLKSGIMKVFSIIKKKNIIFNILN